MGRSVELLPPELPRSDQVRSAALVESAPHGVLRFSIAGNRRCPERPQVPPTASKVAQDFVSWCKIAMALTGPDFGEEKAQSCENA